MHLKASYLKYDATFHGQNSYTNEHLKAPDENPAAFPWQRVEN
jgi:hypothetical protein